jgi:two-component system, OmpR family, sensor histidine kinase ArlS
VKIRDKLTLLYSILTVSILFLFASVIFFSARESREREFYDLLEREAVTKGNLFLNARVPTQLLQDIYRNNRELLNEVEVAIYSTDNELLYHDAVEIDFVKETPEMLKAIMTDGTIRFYQDDWQVLGTTYLFDGKTYLITAAAYDMYGYNKLNNLYKTLLVVFIFSLLLIFVAGRFYSKKAFDPIRTMATKMKEISATNLGLRLAHSEKGDEIAELTATFNGMLERLENSFDAQKHFVSNISHELRTPLAAIIAELELTLDKEQDNAAYKAAINRALLDAKRLVRLSNSLLDLAKASYDTAEISFKPLRVDELLMDVIQQLSKSDWEYKVNLEFQGNPEDEKEVMVMGNAYLLSVAFFNLIENGCKFSPDKSCKVTMHALQGKLTLSFEDQGIGIPEAEKEVLFKPFFRGTNQYFAEGNGVGLSLTQKILRLHKGNISILKGHSKGSIFEVELTHL